MFANDLWWPLQCPVCLFMTSGDLYFCRWPRQYPACLLMTSGDLLQGVERGRERGRHVWEPDEFCLSLAATSSPTSRGVQQVKGIRAVSIMDTLLAGEAPPPSPPQPPCPPVPAPAAPSHRARGRTPDWIKRIFEFAKRGNLEQLVRVWSDKLMCNIFCTELYVFLGSSWCGKNGLFITYRHGSGKKVQFI
jgi:hypothetical protein